MNEPMRQPPSVAEVRSWLGVSLESFSDEELATVLAAERGAQWRVCVWRPMPPNVEPLPEMLPAAIYQALLRRCARAVAAKNLPLGLAGTDEFGLSRLPRYDAEIERLEATYRRIVFA